MMATCHRHDNKNKVFIYDMENNVIQDEITIEGEEMCHIDFSCNDRYLAIAKNDNSIAYKKLVN